MAQKAKTQESKQKQADQKQLYGLYILIHPSSDEPSVQKLHAEICEIIKKQGDVKESKECVKQELSFPIQKAVHAHTGTIYFTADPEHIADISNSVKMVDGPLLRHILTKETHIPSAESAFIMPEEKEPESPPEESTPTQSKPTDPTQQQEKSKITIEDIDKKLDEIMGNV